MSSLVFLLVKSAKITLLELRRKPAKLALWVLVIAGIGGIFLLSLFTRQNAAGSLIRLAQGHLFLFILLFVVIISEAWPKETLFST